MSALVVIGVCLVLTLVELAVVGALISPGRAKASLIRARYPAAVLLAVCVGAGVVAASNRTSSADAHLVALVRRAALRQRALRAAASRRRGLSVAEAPDSLVAFGHRGEVPIYSSEAGDVTQELSDPASNGVQLVFLVKYADGGWLDVYLPERPNGSTGWVRSSEVSVARDPYYVLVNLTAHMVTVWDGTKVFMRVPVGVGRAVSPTPDGTYYVTETVVTGDPEGPYGPYALGLSAHSDVYDEFDGGDGQIGLHGTDDPAGIGTDVSHGCIRMQNDDITRLAHVLPLGTPVVIRRTD